MSDGGAPQPVKFLLDGVEVEALPGETIWQVANRRGVEICRISAGIRSRATAPTAIAAPAWSRSRASACSPPPASASRRAGMKVKTASERAKVSRKLVFELLVADQPKRAAAHDPVIALLALGRPGRRRGQPLPARASSARARPLAIRRWRSISTPASNARSASAPAARCRSTTSSAWPSAASARRSCSISTTRWATAPASPAANASRPARPAR